MASWPPPRAQRLLLLPSQHMQCSEADQKVSAAIHIPRNTDVPSADPSLALAGSLLAVYWCLDNGQHEAERDVSEFWDHKRNRVIV